MPAIEHLDELLTYFEHTYIRGRRLRGRGERYNRQIFAIQSWNQPDAAGDGVARINNIYDVWHNSLQSLLQYTHPTLWRFIEGLQNDCLKQKTNFLHNVTGVQQLAEKKYLILRDEVLRVASTYGETDVLTYLHAIAHLSYS